MRKSILFLLLVAPLLSFAQAPGINPVQWPGIKGLWTFDDPYNLLNAGYGTNLTLTGSHTAIAGPQAGDGAVNIGVGSYYTCYHNISTNGGGTKVNEYSLVIDFRIPVVSPWYCFYQTQVNNNNDGELFVSPNAKVGRATNGPGYTDYSVVAGEWYRLVVTADLGNHYNIYLDGIWVKEGGSLALDGDFSLSPASASNFFYLFADENGEDAPIDIALCAVFEGALSTAEVDSLGGYGHDIPPVLTGILPYLQTPTPTSVYVSWHSDNLNSTQVQFGTTTNLGSNAIGNYETIGTKHWHTVKLSNLSPNTEYYYKCISGTEESGTFAFRTPPATPPEGYHLRFLVFGDNQSDVAKSSYIAHQARLKMQQLFGNDLQNSIQLVLHLGDIVGDGSNTSSFETEYFKPFSELSRNIPNMVTIGNHEGDNNAYYQYMKYEELPGAPAIIAERYYSFSLLNAVFLAINANYAYQSATQLGFIQGRLDAAATEGNTDFVFLYGHMPGHSEIWPDGNTPWIQNQLIPQMTLHPKVAAYFCGHTHAYEHATMESVNDTTGYHLFISGGGGGPLDRWGMYANQTNYPEVHKSLDQYCFNLVDIDVTNHSYTAYTFSLGNTDKPLACVQVDDFHRNLTQWRPNAPVPNGPVGVVVGDSGPLVLKSLPMAGPDSLFGSQFQLSVVPGNYSVPLIDTKRCRDDWYGDSGPPDYLPVNLNANTDLTTLTVSSGLNLGQTYYWRARYRDENLKWSEWSAESAFTPVHGLSVSGTVYYNNLQQSPIPGTLVKLYRDTLLVAQANTDANGHYTFSALLPGNYHVQCATSLPWGGVNATDALLVLKHFVGMSQLTGVNLKAADPDGNSHVNSADALYVSKRFIGAINAFPAGDWVYGPAIFNLENDLVLDIPALCVGDCNGSNNP